MQRCEWCGEWTRWWIIYCVLARKDMCADIICDDCHAWKVRARE